MSGAPEFRTMWAAARSRARERAVRRRSWAAGAALCGAALVAVALLSPGRRAPQPLDLAEVAALSERLEASPLDFLLETPGLARLESTPAFGDPLQEEDWSAGGEREERS